MKYNPFTRQRSNCVSIEFNVFNQQLEMFLHPESDITEKIGYWRISRRTPRMEYHFHLNVEVYNKWCDEQYVNNGFNDMLKEGCRQIKLYLEGELS